MKKIKEVDEIFENVNKANRESDENPKSLRISIDTKSHLKLGEFSRNGKARDLEPKKAPPCLRIVVVPSVENRGARR